MSLNRSNSKWMRLFPSVDHTVEQKPEEIASSSQDNNKDKSISLLDFQELTQKLNEESLNTQSEDTYSSATLFSILRPKKNKRIMEANLKKMAEAPTPPSYKPSRKNSLSE